MKNILFVIIVLALPTMLWSCYSASSGGKTKENARATELESNVSINKNIAVLELFTSQGCSSCPPAERLLGTYINRQNVIPLSFHVDYWNRLGWVDSLSSKQFTQRQYDYASALHSDVYTPQLVINGEMEFVGSDASKIAENISRVLHYESEAKLSIDTLSSGNRAVQIKYEVVGNTGNSVLNIAIVEKKITTTVSAGENNGATLTSFNVVRNFKTINEIYEGTNKASIDLPASLALNNLFIVLYLQNKGNGGITAACESDL